MNYEIGLCYVPNSDTNTVKLPNFNQNDNIEECEVTINDEILHSSSYEIKDNLIVFKQYYDGNYSIKVKCKITTKGKKIIVANNNKNTRAMFTRNLENNSIYENTIYYLNLLLNGESFETKFISKLNPLYCDIKTIRTDDGLFIQDISDDDIIKFLYDNSVKVEEKAETVMEKDTTKEITDDQKRLWVRYRTDLDLLIRKYIDINNKYGTKNKKVGPIEIEDTTKLPYLDKLLEEYKAKLQEAENAFTENVIASNFVKAGNTLYPLNSRVGF